MLSSVLVLPLLAFPALANGNHTRPTRPKVSTAWYATEFPLSSVPWSKYTQMTYAITTSDVNIPSIENLGVLPKFVAAAKKHGGQPSLSIGGWTGSRFFSPHVASASNRTKFVKTITDIVIRYKLPAIDLDWEYANKQGLGCNAMSPQDTPNFLKFLQELRASPIGAKLTLTAAVAPSTSVAGFAKVLDYIVPMVYDINRGWSEAVGANEPLVDSRAPPANQAGSATSAIKAWVAAGIPANQLVPGVPGYGHSFYLSKSDAYSNTTTKILAAYPPFDKTKQPVGDAWDGEAGGDTCDVAVGPGGNWNYWELIKGGYITPDRNATKGIDYRSNDYTKTQPFVYNPEKEVMISFDNVASFAAKGSFIAEQGLLGFALWEAGGDQQALLVDLIRKSAGFRRRHWRH